MAHALGRYTNLYIGIQFMQSGDNNRIYINQRAVCISSKQFKHGNARANIHCDSRPDRDA
jgi:hypothetical protein